MASFRDQLIAMRDQRHSKNHPFFNLWAQGKLTKEQTALYCIQHYYFVSEYLNWMAYEASQIPHRDVKAYLFENLSDEENPEDRHLDMLTDYVEACGLKRESVEQAKVLPGPRRFRTGAGAWSIEGRGRRRSQACSSGSNLSFSISVKNCPRPPRALRPCAGGARDPLF